MPQCAQEQKYYDTSGGAFMKSDIPFVAINIVTILERHS